MRREMTYEPDEDHTNEDAQQVLRHFADRLKQMQDRLKEISEELRPEEITWILQDVRQLQQNIARCLDRPRDRYLSRQSRSAEPLDNYIIERYTQRHFTTDFDKFLEDIYSLGDFTRAKSIADMLQIDIWSTRPQLFEVWVLLKLMSWLRGRGYTIELMRTENVGEQSPFRWNISYSKDSKPCAVVQDIQGGSQQFLFYQLYRPSGDMPDISLLERSDPSSSPIWAIDPKHSEKGGYSKSDYQKTAIRYRDSFGAKLSLVVEYFDRSELEELNPIEFGPSAKLIHGCYPDGNGIPILLRELDKFHPIRGQVLVCIDFSSSFSTKRDGVLDGLRRLYKSGLLTNMLPECICFAGNATILGNFDHWLNAEDRLQLLPGELVEGTESAPLLSTILNLKERMPISEIVILTDGGFDIPIENLINQIQDKLAATATVISS